MITLTPKAAEKLQATLEKQGKPRGFLRIKVTAGGCSGLNMEFDVTDRSSPEDKVYESHGAKVVVDPKSEFFLHGAQVDFESTLMRQGFVVGNPNAKSTCSCGTSFSV